MSDETTPAWDHQHPHDIGLGIGIAPAGAGEDMAAAPERPGAAAGTGTLDRDDIPPAPQELANTELAPTELAHADPAAAKGPCRDDTAPHQGSRFRKGQSGNPAGRPSGARNRTTMAMEALLEEDARAIMGKAIDKAKDGDSIALRLCLDRLAPVRRERCISFALPEISTAADAAQAAAAIVAGVAAGELTAAEAANLGKLVESYVRTLEAAEFDARLRRLEEEKSGGGWRR